MSNRLKIFYATVIVAIVSGWIFFAHYPEVAILTVIAGMAFVASKSLNRCRTCGSWRTIEVDEFFVDTFDEDLGTVVTHRHCLACKKQEYLGSRSMETWEWEPKDF